MKQLLQSNKTVVFLLWHLNFGSRSLSEYDHLISTSCFLQYVQWIIPLGPMPNCGYRVKNQSHCCACEILVTWHFYHVFLPCCVIVIDSPLYSRNVTYILTRKYFCTRFSGLVYFRNVKMLWSDEACSHSFFNSVLLFLLQSIPDQLKKSKKLQVLRNTTKIILNSRC